MTIDHHKKMYTPVVLSCPHVLFKSQSKECHASGSKIRTDNKAMKFFAENTNAGANLSVLYNVTFVLFLV